MDFISNNQNTESRLVEGVAQEAYTGDLRESTCELTPYVRTKKFSL